jgi:D-glycero-D-manno-heptose 1,7-bisphosphate phosphatase
VGEKNLKKAIFLDRDGVINIDHGFVYQIEKFEFVDGIFEFLKEAQRRGYTLIIVTNQSGIGRGYYTLEDFEKLTDFMIKQMQKEGINISKEQIFFCPHAPEENCSCRKPEPKMILDAKDKFNIDLGKSYLIGDKITDIEAGIRAGIPNNILITKNSKISMEAVDGLQ